MGGKIIYKDMKKVEALQNFHIVSGIRTRSIFTWIKPIIFLTVFPNRQQDADLAALCILSQWHRASGATTGEAGGPHVLTQALPSGLSSAPSTNQDWNPSFFLFLGQWLLTRSPGLPSSILHSHTQGDVQQNRKLANGACDWPRLPWTSKWCLFLKAISLSPPLTTS